MSISSFWGRFLGKEYQDTSKSVAKERLRLVLVHDRLDVSEQMMDSLRVDMISVIGKYFGIDEKALDVSLTRETDGMALVVNIPIVGPRRGQVAEAAPAKDAKAAPAKDAKATPAKDAKAAPAKDGKTAPTKDAKAAPAKDGAGKKNDQAQKGAKKKSPPQPAPIKNKTPEQAMEAYIK